jgi:hypothetical protein
MKRDTHPGSGIGHEVIIRAFAFDDQAAAAHRVV